MEANKSLCYKFIIMGVEIYGGIGVFSVNKSVVHAVNVFNCRCHSGFVIFVGGVQIIWD